MIIANIVCSPHDAAMISLARKGYKYVFNLRKSMKPIIIIAVAAAIVIGIAAGLLIFNYSTTPKTTSTQLSITQSTTFYTASTQSPTPSTQSTSSQSVTTASTQSSQETQTTTITMPPPSTTTTSSASTQSSSPAMEALWSLGNTTVKQATLTYTGSVYITALNASGPGATMEIRINVPTVEFSYINESSSADYYIAANITISSASQGISITMPLMLGLEVSGNYSCLAFSSPLIARYTNGSAIKFCGEARNYTGVRLKVGNTKIFEGELSYIGSSTWNGQTTYCFQTVKPYTNTTNLRYLFSNVTSAASFANASLSLSRMCLLSNGIPTTLLGSLNITTPTPKSNILINFDFNLIGLSSTFDQAALNNLMAHAINITQLMHPPPPSPS